MELLQKPPKWLVDLVPDSAKPFVEGWGWYAILGLIGLLILLLLFVLVRRMFSSKKEARPEKQNLEERLAEYPSAKPSTGDRQLRIEGVPVRMRLIVVAPAGEESAVDADAIDKLLDRILPGLGGIFNEDRPRLRIWPRQLSYEGFAKHFHRNTIIPEGDRELSPWAVVAGRAKLGKFQVMVGMALQAIKPNSIGRKTIEAHQWDELLRVRVRD